MVPKTSLSTIIVIAVQNKRVGAGTGMVKEQVTFDANLSKRVSFIVPTKNRANYLDRTLTLAREFVKPVDELIIVDGLSTDHTVEVINRHSDIVSLFLSEPDISAGHALNKGILLSRGMYIRHIPDDDVLCPEGLDQAIEVLERHSEIDLLVCGGTKQSGASVYAVCLPLGIDYGKSMEDPFRYGACGAGFIIRRSAIPLIGLIPIGPASDIEYVVQSISRGGNVKFCRIKLYHHPIYDHSYTVKYRREWDADVLRIRRQYGLTKSYLHTLLKSWVLRALRQYMPEFAKGPLRRVMRRPRRDARAAGPIWDGGFS